MHREDSKAKRLPLIITAAYMRPLMFNYGFKFTLFNAERNIYTRLEKSKHKRRINSVALINIIAQQHGFTQFPAQTDAAYCHVCKHDNQTCKPNTCNLVIIGQINSQERNCQRCVVIVLL